MSSMNISLPPQQLPMSKKTKTWRKQHLDWADSKTFFNCTQVRNSTLHKKINYDLFNGKLHMQDVEAVLNPEHLKEKESPTMIQHYPIINSKLQLLVGEEYKRPFKYRMIVTNPNSISEIEENKKEAVFQQLQQLMQDQSSSEEEFQKKLDNLGDFFTYNWQDIREIRANCLLNHYSKEYNMPLLFNKGFADATIVGEEIYQCDIRGGEPIIEKLNPCNVRVFKSGTSNKIEDADVIIIEDYWSPGQVIDAYYDVLSKKDIEYIESAPDVMPQTEGDGYINERAGFVNHHMIDDTIYGTDEDGMGFYFDPLGLFSDGQGDLMPFDVYGNIKVLRVYWKSRRRIKKIKSYDENGKETFGFYPETYILNEELGEEEEILYINEAWEGTKIGNEIYVNMRPRVVQYNRLTNPSRCHFGIVGSIYNINDNRPYSLVDMMKPYNYMYDVLHDRLNKLMAKNWGKIITLDLAKVPKGWTVDKWLYFAKKNNMAIIDSFKEGNVGAATGKLAGALNNASSGVIDAELGNSIQMYINTLEFIKMEMSEVVGISKQREGQISNRETVGGVERATLQSSHVTEWIFTIHDDVKRRALECFIETAKICLKGSSKKFPYLLPSGAETIVTIDGDEFAESDYGLVMDDSSTTQELNQKIDMLAQAAMQTQTVSFSTILKLYSSISIAEKQRLIENDEKRIQERQSQQAQAEQQLREQELQQQAAAEQARLEHENTLNERDNETKILIANINKAATDDDGINEPEYSQESKDKLLESIRQFDARLDLDMKKLEAQKAYQKENLEIKRAALKNRSRNNK